MLAFLQRGWFLIALASSIVAGHLLGAYGPPEAHRAIETVFNDSLKAWLNAAVLFCMSVTLDGGRLRQALFSPTPVLWAVTVNALLMPLAAPVLMPLQLSPDFAAGLLIAASVPSTMAAASVWTRRAGGNDAISLLVTLITNAGCVLYTPFWLLTFGSEAAQLNAGSLIEKLILTALVPTILGQVIRRHVPAARFADRHKTAFGVAAQIGILLVVSTAACAGGIRFARDAAGDSVGSPAPTAVALLVVTACCIALHLVAMGVAWAGARVLRISREDRIAVAFAASQKTLPIGLLIATDPDLFGTVFPWAVFPMLIYHASQLFIDAVVADLFASRTARAIAVSGSGEAGPSPDAP